MKICLINNLYKPYAHGGTERVMELISKGLLSLGHEVYIITTRPFFSCPKKFSKEKIYYLPSTYHFWNKLPKMIRPLFHIFNIFNIFTARKILKIIQKNKIDLIIGNNLLGINILFLKLIKIKYIHILHDIQLLHPSGLMLHGKEKIINTFLAKIYQKYTKFLIKNVDKIISPSKWLLDQHEKKSFFIKKKTQILLNPIEMNGKENISKIKTKDYFILLFVGLLSEPKGLLVLFKAFELLTKNNKNFKLILIGRNIIGKKLDFYLSRNNNIEYKGELTHEQVFKNMIEADALIMPSLCYENSPTVIYEADNFKLPVLASRIGGIPELFKNYSESLFTPGDSQDLAKKILKLKNNHYIQIKYYLSPDKYVIKLLS